VKEDVAMASQDQPELVQTTNAEPQVDEPA